MVRNFRHPLRMQLLLVLLACGMMLAVAPAQVQLLGPDGGDVRKLAYFPDNPDRLLLGTSSGTLFISENSGATWSRFAHFGQGFDYVLDDILFSPKDPRTVYVAAWSVERDSGELFRSRDGGKSWTSLAGVRGKSIRSLALTPADPKMVFIGALDGVFRSLDGGETWKQISPPNHRDIRSIESLAVDPKDPNVIYAGTWHLPWKTNDGGATWHQIKRGMIDDSDIFSIIIDPRRPAFVYASACSGIYRSETAGELFTKAQGIPFSARRTRVLKQDANNADVVYAGTTEGLWRTTDAGRKWQRVSAANLIINDVLIDPRDSNHVMLATDRSGVMISTNGTKSWVASNRGFTHRQVATVLVDRTKPDMIYAGLLNDKEFGGVFVSQDSGAHWTQMSAGLAALDVVSLAQDNKRTLFAGTNRGFFRFEERTRNWTLLPLTAKKNPRINSISMEARTWWLATAGGLFSSSDAGRTWKAHHLSDKDLFVTSVQAKGELIVASTHTRLFVSTDGGTRWNPAHPPAVSVISSVAVDANSDLWLTSPEGAFHRTSGGWLKVSVPGGKVVAISFDPHAQMLLAATNSGAIVSTTDGRTWRQVREMQFPVRSVVPEASRLFAVTSFDGIVAFDRTAGKQSSAKLAGASENE